MDIVQGYLPRNQDRREVTLARKRKDFADTANQAFSKGVAGLDYTLYHQVINLILQYTIVNM